METPMPFYKELATAGGSTYVNAVMAEKFQREVTILRVDELELIKKAQELRSRVAERDFLLEEMKLLFPFESTVKGMLALNHLNAQDLKEAAEMLGTAMKKKTRQAELMLFIEKLKLLPY